MRKIRRALLSVHNKAGLVELARALDERHVEILATGGTARVLREAGIAVTSVSSATGAPEILGGRVKTLHPKIHGALLAQRDDPQHIKDLAEQGIEPIELVVANLYPFEEVVAGGAWLGEAIENIDIGGPTMIRAAAKNYAWVGIVTDPADYAEVVAEMKLGDGFLSDALLERLAARAWGLIARYDAAIASYFSTRLKGSFAADYALAGHKLMDLRYGENPHQRAAVYATGTTGLAAAIKLQGKELSYNNYLDLDAALACVNEFEQPAAVIVKHTNPCGVAVDAALTTAYERARAADPVSAFGGVVALNRPIDAATATALTATFIEAVVAPGVADEARALLATKTALRVLVLGAQAPGAAALRSISGGFLVQDADNVDIGPAEPQVVTKRAPSEAEWRALRFAWKVAKHVKSNAIVFTTESATVGVGAGQMSRVDSARIAVEKAKTPLHGTVVGSDAFFPFRDGLDVVAKAGATAVIQPGGSVRDEEVIAAANEHGLAMVVTGIRHFKH